MTTPAPSPAAPSPSPVVVIRLHQLDDTRWVFVLDRGKDALDAALGKVRLQRHWMPSPEEVRRHRAGQYDLFKRALQVFEIDRATGGGSEGNATLRWRIVDAAGRSLREGP